ncbi:TAXI family TRAP transporter solute-binding subunit [Nitratiruptor tergarcus]|uniref:NMT1-like family protein n=1 Tax=Nitratiruptor tergarcus DSM 16512 TaxID=1069081 RepID=A0A1W1WR56_9BACT|nr:TAXI family TRAP transporter solute-binding subunit [Nitratiruptor tergarcus]SMC08777.1 NMT1-like family protein [Nitratiruptor tergarcus DSM 16512]
MRILLYILLLSAVLFADKIATSYQGTSDYNVISNSILNTYFTIEETKGDIQSLRSLLKNPATSLAVVQEDIIKDVIREDFALKERLKIVSPLYRAAILIITPKNSEIKNLKDLSNRRVIVDSEGSGDFYTFLNLQEKYTITPEIFNIKKNEAIKYLKRSKADAFFYIGNIKDIAYLYPSYNFIPVVDSNYKLGFFDIDNNNSIRTAYLDKFLLSTTQKEKRLPKTDLHKLLATLLVKGEREYLCGFTRNTPVQLEDYIYFVCAEHITPQQKSPSITHAKHKKKIAKKLYYDDIEDITIYPIALKNKNFDNYGTSYIVEKTKLDNAIKLIKKEIKEDPSCKIVIISKGNEAEAIEHAKLINRYFKKAHIKRKYIINKVLPIPCNDNCFYSTTITFKQL